MIAGEVRSTPLRQPSHPINRDVAIALSASLNLAHVADRSMTNGVRVRRLHC